MLINSLGAAERKILKAQVTAQMPCHWALYLCAPKTVRVSLVIKNANMAIENTVRLSQRYVGNFPNQTHSLNVRFHKVKFGSLLYLHDNVFI